MGRRWALVVVLAAVVVVTAGALQGGWLGFALAVLAAVAVGATAWWVGVAERRRARGAEAPPLRNGPS